MYTRRQVINYKRGQRVRYIPNHANGNKNHEDCKDGVVSSCNNSYVFVKYDNLTGIMITGDEPFTSQATKFDDLIAM